jgi:hypothetical protein
VVRGFSFFGVSFVYVIFEDGTDLYWARSRVLERSDRARGLKRKGDTERPASALTARRSLLAPIAAELGGLDLRRLPLRF